MDKPFSGRREDFRLLTGRGVYVADRNLPGQLHAQFRRAERAHAEMRRLDTGAALATPGVVAVLTGADTSAAGFKSAPPLVRYPGKDGMRIKVPQRDVLAAQRVHFVGQEVALVVADSAAAAQDGADAIEIEWRDLPVVVDAAAALAPEAPQLHADAPGNLCFDFDYGDAARTAAAFAGAAHVTRVTVDAERMVGNPMEPKSCLAAYSAADDSYDVYVSTQGMSMMLGALAGVTGIAADQIRVHAQDVGGGFGIRSDAYPEYAAIMLAARKLGRPVKWVGSRAETFQSDHHGRAARLAGELALDADGNFLAIRFEWIVNTGAYASNAGPLINTIAPAGHATNVYRIPAVYGRHRLAFTNTTPTTAYRGAARPNVSYIVERLVDEAARETGIDRLELRRRNLIARGAFPYKTPTSVYDSGDPPALLDTAEVRSLWHDFEQRRAAARLRGRLRGIGVAMFIEPSGADSSPKEEVAIKFGSAGDADIFALAGPSGQGHETVFPEIVGEILGLPPERFRLRASDPAGPRLIGDGTIGSRSTMAHGGAMAVAAREVIRKGTALAARHLEVAEADVAFDRGRYRVAGTDLSVGLDELIRAHAGEAEHPLNAMGDIPPPRAFPSGAHVAEVEIDPETGVVELVGYVAVDDCGRVINHTLVEGQLHGGIVQGVGQALGERCVYDEETGQLLTGSFLDYYMPRADSVPPFVLVDRGVPSPGNPLGAKGAGEAGTTGAVPTVASAILDALRPAGVLHIELPCTPQRVWQALAAARRPA